LPGISLLEYEPQNLAWHQNLASKINKDWHENNKMPPKASDDERIKWHIEHTKNCPCRPIPKGVIELMIKKGIAMPEKHQ